MGNAPSAPTEEQHRELAETLAESTQRAGAAIAQADVLLLATGAGWSADSGLAVYKDIANIKAYNERKLTYHDICEPHWLQDEPALFHGFWGSCFNDYRGTKPHEGYAIVRKWRDTQFSDTEVAAVLRSAQEEEHAAAATGKPVEARKADAVPLQPPTAAGAFFTFTSNVDAHSFQHFPSGEVRECHGNSETWQCASRDCAKRLANSAEGSCCQGGRWACPPGFRFNVDPATQLAQPGQPAAPASTVVGDDSQVGPRPVAKVAYDDDSEGAQQPQFSDDEADARWKAAFAGNQPTCVLCGGPARPAILMFNDSSWQDDVPQRGRWERWTDAVEAVAAQRAEQQLPPLKVAIMEVGAGGNVTTVRNVAENTLEALNEAGATATLIRVNPDLPLADRRANQPHTISLQSYGLAAVKMIDATVQGLRCASASTVAAADATPLTLKSAPPPDAPPPPTAVELAEIAEAKAAAENEAAALAVADAARQVQLRTAFAKYDLNGDGKLDRHEVRRMVAEVGEGKVWLQLDRDLDAAMAVMDTDGNGVVSFEEFEGWWEGGGKLSASEKLDLKFAAFSNRFDQVMHKALGAATSR